MGEVKGHPCWSVQSALDEAGIDYVLDKGPVRARSKRTETLEKTGQTKYPWIEFEDGSVLREESKDLEERIRSGPPVRGARPARRDAEAPPAS